MHNTLRNGLGHSFTYRLKHTGDVSSAVMVAAFRSAVQLACYDHPNLHVSLTNLARSLSHLFECTGDIASISSAIPAQQWVVQLTPDGHADMPLSLSNLGNSFSQRFQRTGDVNDILEAISVQKNAVQLVPDSHPDMPLLLSNLGNSLSHHFGQTEDISDILEAILIQQKAIHLTPDGHPDMPLRLSNLGNSFSQRFQQTGNTSDILEAISIQQSAVQLSPDSHPDMPLLLSSLGKSFYHHFRQTGDLEDICETISAHQRAVHLTPDGHPDMPRRLSNLGSSFSSRFKHTGDSLDVENATVIYRKCASIVSAPPSIRLRAALRWAELSASHDPPESYDDAICLISQIAGVDQTRRAKFINISRITATAASAAFAQGDIQRALEWLEQGRCVVWNQHKQLRTLIDDLRSHVTSLIEQFLVVSRVFASPASLKSLQESTTLAHTAIAAREWTQLLDEIRSLHGFDNLQEPLLTSTVLKNLPQGGPVVLINMHEDRCDALALIPGTDTPLHIPLWHFTLRRVLKLMDRVRVASSADSLRAVRPGLRRKSDILQVLKELWLCVVKPVLDALGFSDKVGTILISKCKLVYFSVITLRSPTLLIQLAFGGAQPVLLRCSQSMLPVFTIRNPSRLDHASPTLWSRRTPQPLAYCWRRSRHPMLSTQLPQKSCSSATQIHQAVIRPDGQDVKLTLW